MCPSRGQGKLTTPPADADCPAEAVLRSISGKWKPRIVRLATRGPLRFNQLVRDLKGSNKQAIAVALRELEKDGLLRREVVRLKPLHVEYHLTDRSCALVPLMSGLEVGVL